MIRESLYFSFADRRSTDFGIMNVSISGGLYEEQVAANKSIEEVFVPGNDRPYFLGVKKDPLQFQLHFYFEEKYNDLNNKYLRLAADFDNFRKRTLQEKEELSKYATCEVLKKLTTVLDTFDRANEHLKEIDNCQTVK